MNLNDLKIISKVGGTPNYAEKVIFTGSCAEQVRWGGNDDPEGHLVVGQAYDVEKVEVHTWHTKYWINGRKYNSASFKPVQL